VERFSQISRRIDQYRGRVAERAAGGTACESRRESGMAFDCVFI
jgi:hypothetical protein